MNFDDEWLFNDRPTRTRFIDVIRQANPDVMFIHGPTDYHPDHRAAGQIAEDARIPASVRLVESGLPNIAKAPHIFYMDNPAGLGFQPEAYVDITEVMELKRQMLRQHSSQDTWLRAIYNDASITDMMELKTYPRTGSFALLPGFGG
jgi:LmbE family N-acetylglucosaminyl deacetylase